MKFEAWMLAAIDRAGYNGIREEHMDAVAEELRHTGRTEIDRQTFNDACRRRGIEPTNFTQADLNRLEEKLNC